MLPICLLVAAVAFGAPTEAASPRVFEFTYTTTVGSIPPDAEVVRAWLPVPASDVNQMITGFRVETEPAVPVRFITETTYGNTAVLVEARRDQIGDWPTAIEMTLRYDVSRREATSGGPAVRPAPAAFLRGDAMAPITPEVRRRAESAAAGRRGTLDLARALYDRVLDDVDYDKSGAGWGKGDIAYVCDVGTGNCSDFHSLFIGMSRAQNIPAYFEIGFPLPESRGKGAVGGYHCWAWYEAAPGEWRPVDISEADKHPERTEYYFGTIGSNRVAVSRGRDLVFDPSPASGPINFFVYPVVEIDGAPAGSVLRSFSYEDRAAP